MNRIDTAFQRLRDAGQKAFVPYICAGDPNLEVTRSLLFAFQEMGADVVELGIPFSDPMADGAVNQRAATRALESGTTLPAVFHLVKTARAEGLEVPVLFFTYLNPVLRYRLDRFFRSAKECGVDGVLGLDLPPEEADEFRALAAVNDIATVFLLAPTSTDARIARIAKASTGFVYMVSVTGVTGMRNALPPDLKDNVARIKAATDTPVCVGFGVSSPEQAAAVAGLADGVVVGSALVSLVEKHAPDGDAIIGAVTELAGGMVAAVKGSRREDASQNC